jgi:hypothetical protein
MLGLLIHCIVRYTEYVYINKVQLVKNIIRFIRGLAKIVKAIIDTNVINKKYLKV